jgi:protein SCO1
MLRPLLLVLSLLAAPLAAHAGPTPDIEGVAYEQRLGGRLPLEAMFQDENGAKLRVSDLFEGKPLILALGYYGCKSFCGIVRADLFEALRRSDLVAGRDYSLAFVSIDPSESPAEARAAKTADMKQWPAPGGQRWRFLTGEESSLRALAEAVGFRFRFIEKSDTFMHPTGVVFVTREGVVSNYLTGVGYHPIAVRSALSRAAADNIAAKQSLVTLLCYEYDPSSGRYTLSVMRLLRASAIVMTALVAIVILRALRRERFGA